MTRSKTLISWWKSSLRTLNLKVAKAGPEALEILGSEAIDLVLLDILMEEMDGFEVLRQIKENPETKSIPVIFLTALSEFKDETRGLKAGSCGLHLQAHQPLVVLARVDAQLTVLRQKKELERTNAILSQENARNERELELARNIQRSFHPQDCPESWISAPGTSTTALYGPSAGDFFDFVKLGPQKMGFFLGDVSGHGIPAALVTSMIKVALPFAHQHPDNPSFSSSN
jgi:sigma-B regulation protein RsbU (phosphoserine phosphatase)